jgi:hypothetical protein
MAPAAWGTALALERAVGTRGFVAQAVTGLAPVAAGAVLYFAAALLLRIPEAGTLWSIVRRRRG